MTSCPGATRPASFRAFIVTLAAFLGACAPHRDPPPNGALLVIPGNGSPATVRYLIQASPGYVAHVHRPATLRDGQRAPAIMLIGGSGGGIGWQDYMADLLVQRGFVVMS